MVFLENMEITSRELPVGRLLLPTRIPPHARLRQALSRQGSTAILSQAVFKAGTTWMMPSEDNAQMFFLFVLVMTEEKIARFHALM